MKIRVFAIMTLLTSLAHASEGRSLPLIKEVTVDMPSISKEANNYIKANKDNITKRTYLTDGAEDNKSFVGLKFGNEGSYENIVIQSEIGTIVNELEVVKPKKFKQIMRSSTVDSDGSVNNLYKLNRELKGLVCEVELSFGKDKIFLTPMVVALDKEAETQLSNITTQDIIDCTLNASKYFQRELNGKLSFVKEIDSNYENSINIHDMLLQAKINDTERESSLEKRLNELEKKEIVKASNK